MIAVGDNMVKYEDLFGEREERKDDIKPLLEEMNKFSESMEYEKARDTLDKIKEELKKSLIQTRISESNIRTIDVHNLGNIQTIKDVNNLVTSDSIRLNPDNYKFSDFLGLLVSVHGRKDEIQGARYVDLDKQRRVVAEEMACLGISIPESKGGKIGRSKKPNRAFLDIANKINPALCRGELERREKVMMWKAIESGRIEEIEKARERLKKYSTKKVYI
jgi:hypothetical protein